MAYDRFNRFLKLGDQVRIIRPGRSLLLSDRVYSVIRCQPSILCDVSKILLDNGREYSAYEVLKEEKISCS